MKAIFLAVALLALQSMPVAATEPITTTGKGFGCLDRADLFRAADFVKASDQEAFVKFLQERISSAHCFLISKGETVFVEQSSTDGAICVRPKGETNCLWTIEGIVQ